MTWTFLTTCINSDYESITDMNARAESVSYQTLKKHLGPALTELEENLGYDTGRARGGLRLSKDWAAGFYKSVYRGEPCYFVRWSKIEHIFVKR